MTPAFTRTGKPERARIILAHGAGAGMDSDFMQAFAAGLAELGFESILFNFPYMVKRAEDGKRRPPDRAPKLITHFQHMIEEVGSSLPLIIGGKSMGGRIASMVASRQPAAINGLVLLGYPFHPPGKPEKLAERTRHFTNLTLPTVLVQGERDTFGGKALLSQLSLPASFELHWATDGDHSFKPRKASGRTQDENWKATIQAVAQKNWG